MPIHWVSCTPVQPLPWFTDCDLIVAQTAGLLHDCAKCIPNKKKLKMCSQHNIPVSEFEQTHPFLLHAKLGAYVAKAKYNVTDEEYPLCNHLAYNRKAGDDIAGKNCLYCRLYRAKT